MRPAYWPAAYATYTLESPPAEADTSYRLAIETGELADPLDAQSLALQSFNPFHVVPP